LSLPVKAKLRRRPLYPTSPFHPERGYGKEKWGVNNSLRLLPFQAIAVPAKTRTGIDSNKLIYPATLIEGLNLDEVLSGNKTIQSQQDRYDLTIPAWGVGAYNYFFYPNPMMTLVLGRYTYYGWRRERKYCKATVDGSLQLAAIYFCFVDIDFKTVSQSFADELIAQSPIPPDVIVHSGNGYHLYFRVKTISLLERLDEYREWISLYKKTTDCLKKFFKADLAQSQRLRIPNTTNFKIDKETGLPNMTECREIKGSIIESYFRESSLTLEQLLLAFAGAKTADLKKVLPYYESKAHLRPKPNLEGLDDARKNFVNHFGLKRLNKSKTKFFNYIYGFRNQPKYIELRDEFDGNFLGMNGTSAKHVRHFFQRLKVIRLLKKANKFARKSAEFELTDLFWQSIGQSEPNYITAKKVTKRSIHEIVGSEPYQEGELRAKLKADYRDLRNRGFQDEEITEYLLSKASHCGGRSNKDASDLLKWCRKYYKHNDEDLAD